MSYQQRKSCSRARQDRSSLHHSKSGLDLVTKRDRVRGSYMAAIRGLDLSLDNPLKLTRLREDNDACHISFSIKIDFFLNILMTNIYQTYRGDPTP